MKNFLSILLFSLTVSCSNTSSDDRVLNKIEIAKSEAVDIHDELMLQMGDLKSLKKELSQLLVISKGSTEKVEVSIVKISDADKAMWDWMHNFNIAYQGKNDSLTLVYFESKLKGIQEVSLLFDSAINKSAELLE